MNKVFIVRTQVNIDGRGMRLNMVAFGKDHAEAKLEAMKFVAHAKAIRVLDVVEIGQAKGVLGILSGDILVKEQEK